MMTPTQDDDDTLRNLALNIDVADDPWTQPPDKGPIPASAVAEYEDRPAPPAASAPVAQYIPPLIRLPKDAKPAPAPAPDDSPLPVPPPEEETKDAGVGAQLAGAFASLPAEGAGGDAGAVAPPKEDTSAGSPKSDLSYETWLTSHPQKPVGDNGSWLARAGETANAAGVGRKPDYGWVNKLDEEDAAKAGAPQKAYGQWLLAQKTQSEINKNNRPGTDPSVAANIKAVTAEKVAQIRADLAKLLDDHKYAFGDRKLALEREIADKKNALGVATNASREFVAGENRDAAESRFNAGQKIARDRDVAHHKEADTQGLTTKIVAQNALAGTLSEFERIAPGSTSGDASNLPSALDLTAAKIPLVKSVLSSENANKIQQLKNDLGAQIALLRSGKALNEVEIKNLDAFLGSDWVTRPDMMSNALRLVKLGLYRSTRATEQAYGRHGNEADDYSVLDDVLSKIPEAITSRHPMFKGLGGAQASGGAAPSGEPDLQPGEVLMVDPDGVHHAVLEKDVQEAEEKAGYRRL